jgi:hypothetical protein
VIVQRARLNTYCFPMHAVMHDASAMCAVMHPAIAIHAAMHTTFDLNAVMHATFVVHAVMLARTSSSDIDAPAAAS